MLIYNQRMTDSVINRCHAPGDGDIMVPVHTVAILGTTDIRVEDPDDYEITRTEVGELIAEGAKLFPDLPNMRLLRAYAGVRPLYEDTVGSAEGDDRAITRAHAVIDHQVRDGVSNFVSIVGGKATTYRLMAQETADLVCSKIGVAERCTTGDEILPGQEKGHSYWLGHRLDDHERAGGGDADLICECELVTRSMLDRFLDSRWPCSLDDVRRGTRLGMGPCQGGFCTFRAAGIVAQRVAEGSAAEGNAARPAEGAARPAERAAQPAERAAQPAERAAQPAEISAQPAEIADRAIRDFLSERFKGTRPIAWGRQLQELWMVSGIYSGVLGIESLPSLEHLGPAEESVGGPS
jgi:glycerol-3-phosphate dehydrogenase